MDESTNTDLDELNNSILDDISNITSNNVWGRLVSLNPAFPHVEIVDDSCLFGRAKECNVQYDLKKVSANHCRIYRSQTENEVDYRYFIEDLSSNGTWLNKKKLGKSVIASLVSGNEVSLTSCIDSNDPLYVSYQFQDVAKLRRYEEERQKRIAEEDEKRKKQQEEEEEKEEKEKSNVTVPTPLKSDKTEVDLQSTVDLQSKTPTKLPSGLRRQSTKESIKSFISKLTESTNSNTSTSDTDQIMTPINPLKRKLSQSDEHSDEVDKDGQGNEKKLKLDDTDITTTTTTTSVSTTSTSSKSDEIANNSLQENLICGICHEILYKCITLIPCMHNYCSYCYGEVKERSCNCPQCRQKVSFAQINHTINNLVEALLKKNPEWKRDLDELDDMDRLCKLKLDNGATVKSEKEKQMDKWRRRYMDDFSQDELNSMTEDDFREMDEENDWSDDYSEEDDGYRYNTHPTPFPPANTCRYCTNPSTLQNNFQCSPTNPIHQFCGACNQKFPSQTPPPVGQQCKLCLRNFCGAYGPCLSLGFLKQAQLRDHHLTNMPPNVFNGNQFEQKVTQDYLVKNNINFGSLWSECVSNIENNDPLAQAYSQGVGENDFICSSCANGIFKNFLFEHRGTVDKSKLPDYAQARDDCYYGSQCRTQFNKFDHAKKFNHVCKQKRFH